MYLLSNPGTLSMDLKHEAPGDIPALLHPGLQSPCLPHPALTQAEQGGKAEQGEGGNSALGLQQWSHKVK